MVVISLLDCVFLLEDPHFRVLLGLAAVTVSLQGLIIRWQLSQSLMPDASNIVAVEGSLQEPRCSKVADARLAAGNASSEKPGSDRLKTVQEIKRSRKKNQSKTWRWSREGRQNPLLPTNCEKGGYVFTEELLELAPFAKTLRQDQMIPSVIDIVFLLYALQKEHLNEDTRFIQTELSFSAR